MNNSVFKSIIYLLVGVSILLSGMKMMSGGLRKSVGKRLKKFFKTTQDNPWIGLGIGTIATAAIQSSDATSAMVIGFINTGAMTIFQGLTMILGAYIGTTITGVLASFSSLPISTYLLLLAFIGTLMMFLKNDKIKNFGEILCGLGLLFFGLAVMKDAFGNEIIREACTTLFLKINFPVLLFLLGVLITAVIQSSSAVTSIVIAMVGGGALTLSSGLYLALGATLGTVATTLLASLDGSIKGKKTACIAFSMRTVTSVIMLIILMIFESPITKFLQIFAVGGKDELPLAMFTVIYNIIFMPLLIPFIKWFIKLSDKFIVEKENPEIVNVVGYIDDKLIVTPDIAMLQLKKEILNMYNLSYENYCRGFKKIVNHTNEFDNDILITERRIDYLNKRISEFMIKLSGKVDGENSAAVGSYFHVINDIERIGDHAINFYEMANEMDEKEFVFSKYAIDELNNMNKPVEKLFALSKNVFENDDISLLYEVKANEDATDDFKKEFMTNHYIRVRNNQCSDEMTPYLTSFVTDLERVADHLNNISYILIDPTGADEV